MEDLLDLGEERRRGSATFVRTDMGGLGPGFGGWGGSTSQSSASLERLGPAGPRRPERTGPELRRGEAREEAASSVPPHPRGGRRLRRC